MSLSVAERRLRTRVVQIAACVVLVFVGIAFSEVATLAAPDTTTPNGTDGCVGLDRRVEEAAQHIGVPTATAVTPPCIYDSPSGAVAPITADLRTTEDADDRIGHLLRHYDDRANLACTNPREGVGSLAPNTTGGDDCERNLYRGTRPGEPVSFQPKPGEYKVDPDSGTFRPTRGVSVFDNRERLVGMGLVPHRIDLTSVPSELRIIQQGLKPDHYEITPRPETVLLPAEYVALLSQIRTLD